MGGVRKGRLGVVLSEYINDPVKASHSIVRAPTENIYDAGMNNYVHLLQRDTTIHWKRNNPVHTACTKNVGREGYLQS